MNKRDAFEYSLVIEKNRKTAMDMYGDKLDENRNIVGTNYYFDSFWRLREKGGADNG